MKRIIFLSLLVFIIIGCKSESKTSTNQNNEMPKFNSVKEMLVNSADFNEEDGSLKFISDNPENLHIQISKPLLSNELENNKKETVIRDIVYVSFQTFAQTNLNKITITSIPSNFEKPNEYFESYKMTIEVNREEALLVLKKFLNTEDFATLYSYDTSFSEGLWLPNKNFSILKFDKLDEVFAMIKN